VTALQRITSRQHAVVRRFRRIALGRDGDGVLLDGEHLIEEALDAGVPIEIMCVRDAPAALVERAQTAGAVVYQATPAVIQAVSPVKTPSGIAAIAQWQPESVERALGGASPLVVGLVDVQDPGNVGGVVRAAAGLGASGVLALDRSADPRGWRALRGAMGSTFRVPVARGTSAEAIPMARRRGLRIAAAIAGAGEPIASANLRRPLLVLLGSEGAGVPPAIERQADLRLTVPMAHGVESLNVAVTAGIILYEIRRQRAGGPS
jgi:TrmH family RNA methyltransferase